MSLGSGTPDPDAFTLDAVGRGARGGGSTSLQRREGDAWVTIGRYADRAEAARALDRAIADGGAPADHRLVTDERRWLTRSMTILPIVLAVIVVYSLWQIID